MNDLIEMLENDTANRTPEQSEAIYMHEQLIIHRQMVETGLAGMCRDLKEIRDRKLYLQLGYEEFGAYTESEHGIKQRQAYKYIQVYEKLGVEFLHLNAKMGVTKLLEIAALDKDEREELLAEYTPDELAAMPTEEVKRLTEQVKKLEEQISFLQEEKRQKECEPPQVVQQPFGELEAVIRAEVEEELRLKHASELAKFESKIAELESKAVSDEELKKYKANAEKEAKAAASEETKKLRAELKAANEAESRKSAELDKLREEKQKAEEKAKEAEARASRAAELEAKITAAEAEKAAVEKQIKLSADPEFTRFKFLFEAWQNSMSALIEQLGKLDEDKQSKMVHAMKAVVEGMGL
jgi:chromosome segregation ATPase